jgi:hypothetical protein
MMFGLAQAYANIATPPSTSPCDVGMLQSGYLCNVDMEGNVTYQQPPVTQAATQTAANAANVNPIPQTVDTGTVIVLLGILWVVMSRHKKYPGGHS